MKKLKTAFILTLATTSSVFANTYSWIPSDSDLADLDHYYSYEWAIKWNVPSGETITGATLQFNNIWDWTREDDTLWVNLLNSPTTITSIASGSQGTWSQLANDNQNPGNAFASVTDKVLLGAWHDPAGGQWSNFDLVYNLANIGGVNYLNTLSSYLNDGKLAFGFDPDCHYYNDGIKFTITTTRTVPDGGSAMLMLGCAVAGLEGFRRRFVRKA